MEWEAKVQVPLIIVMHEPEKPRVEEVPIKKRRRWHGTRRGFFHPKHPEKYEGNVKNIIYRSGIELRFMKFLDDASSIKQWSSEEVKIPYISPKDGRVHRYFVDFKITAEYKDGSMRTSLAEVKWSTATKPPKLPKNKRKTRRFLNEVHTWEINKAKWEAAKALCDKMGWYWMVVTEKSLAI